VLAPAPAPEEKIKWLRPNHPAPGGSDTGSPVPQITFYQHIGQNVNILTTYRAKCKHLFCLKLFMIKIIHYSWQNVCHFLNKLKGHKTLIS